MANDGIACKYLDMVALESGPARFAELKAKGSQRSIPLIPRAVAALRRQREQMPADAELVFTRPDGDGWSVMRLDARWRALRTRAGRPDLRLHDLRHTAASLMLAAGVPLFVVSRVLGHASIQITADLYGHLEVAAARSALAPFGAFLDGDAAHDAARAPEPAQRRAKRRGKKLLKGE